MLEPRAFRKWLLITNPNHFRWQFSVKENRLAKAQNK